jgi:hypothetical protein
VESELRRAEEGGANVAVPLFLIFTPDPSPRRGGSGARKWSTNPVVVEPEGAPLGRALKFSLAPLGVAFGTLQKLLFETDEGHFQHRLVRTQAV